MALIPIISQSDGPRTTVSDLTKSPRLIPRRMLQMTEQQFVVDAILRNGGSAPGGVVEYFESSPLFADGDAAIKAEFGEYQYITTSEGQQKFVVATNRGLSIRISEDMRRRNQMERVNIQLQQAKNTLLKTWDGAFRTSLLAAGLPSFNASGTTEGWEASDAVIAKDILLAKQMVGEAEDAAQADNFFGFVADTMVCSIATANLIIGNDKWREFYRGNLADENILYKGKLPNQIEGLTVLTSRTWPDTEVLICERNTLGFISDERGMQWTPLRLDEDREVWRSNGSRISAIGIDQPKAGVRITNILGVDGVPG